MGLFRDLLSKKDVPTGNTRNIKEVWFRDGASPLRLYPGNGMSRMELEGLTPIVEINDIVQNEWQDREGRLFWLDDV